jgi:epoxide hydrolase 4
MRTRFVPAAGLQLHITEAGHGDAVLLLHGFPDHGGVWAPILPALAATHHAIAPDLRGVNLSDKPVGAAAYRIERLVDDVCALIDSLGGGRCALVGHDWGGLLAWVVAARHPLRVSKLAILNAPHPCLFAAALRDDPAQRAASAYVQRLTAPGAETRLAANDFEILWQVVREAALDRAGAVQAWSQPGALSATLNWYRALDVDAALAPGGVPALPSLGSASGHIEAPTLVLWGDRDGSFRPSCLKGLAHWVPRLQLEHVPEGGHWLQLEQPEFVAERLLAFLGSAR